MRQTVSVDEQNGLQVYPKTSITCRRLFIHSNYTRHTVDITRNPFEIKSQLNLIARETLIKFLLDSFARQLLVSDFKPHEFNQLLAIVV